MEINVKCEVTEDRGCDWHITGGWIVRYRERIDGCITYLAYPSQSHPHSFGHTFLVRPAVVSLFAPFMVACIKKLMEEMGGHEDLLKRLLRNIALAGAMFENHSQYEIPIDSDRMRKLVGIGVDKMVRCTLEDYWREQQRAYEKQHET